jgi:hypothetical protein
MKIIRINSATPAAPVSILVPALPYEWQAW